MFDGMCICILMDSSQVWRVYIFELTIKIVLRPKKCALNGIRGKKEVIFFIIKYLDYIVRLIEN